MKQSNQFYLSGPDKMYICHEIQKKGHKEIIPAWVTTYIDEIGLSRITGIFTERIKAIQQAEIDLKRYKSTGFEESFIEI